MHGLPQRQAHRRQGMRPGVCDAANTAECIRGGVTLAGYKAHGDIRNGVFRVWHTAAGLIRSRLACSLGYGRLT